MPEVLGFGEDKGEVVVSGMDLLVQVVLGAALGLAVGAIAGVVTYFLGMEL